MRELGLRLAQHVRVVQLVLFRLRGVALLLDLLQLGEKLRVVLVVVELEILVDLFQVLGELLVVVLDRRAVLDDLLLLLPVDLLD